MPKIVYDDGREEEISLVGGGRKVGEEEYFKFTLIDKSKEKLREMLTHVMQDRQRQNLLPFEIVQSMLLTIGNSEFADDLYEVIKKARDWKVEYPEDHKRQVEKLLNDFLKKWGLRI